jgi:PAS domain S-box-containing protein
MPESKIRILLIEDNPGDARLVQELLWGATGGASRFEIELADRLSQGLERLSTEETDVVLLDLGLPDSKGLDTVRRLREQTEKAVVVVLTGLDDEEVAVQCLQHGAQDYLVKGRFDGHLLGRSVRYAIERKRAEEALRNSEGRYRALFEGAAEGILVADIETRRFKYANPAVCTMLGYTTEELTRLGMADIHPKESLDHVVGEFEVQARGEKTLAPAIPCLRKDGTVLYADVVAAPAVIDGLPCSIGFFTDVSERKRAEEEIERLARFPRENPNPVLRVAWDGTLLYANPASALLLDTWGCREGAKLPAYLLDVVRDVARSGENREVEVQCPERVFSIIVACVPPERYINLYGRDVTEKKRLEEQLRQAQKMEAVGRLAGGIAHDFNNILTAVIGYNSLLLGRLGEADPARREVAEVEKAAQRAASLTRQLLAFSRQQVLEPKVVNINRLVAEVDQMLRRLIGEDIDLATVLDAHLGNTKVDSGQLEQVVLNLALNARDAMPHGGKITIETANVDLDENYARQHVTARPGSYVMLAVSDTGCGMDAETQSRVFEPFFTTKEMGKGTGLGLSTVYGIVKQSGGYVWVYSELGRGTTFKIYLPRVEGDIEQLKPAVLETEIAGGAETILVVEDDEGIRNLICEILEMNGYTVLKASDGNEALALAARSERPIHLTITDVVMPGVDGRELAKRLAIVRPDLKVLFMSGYASDAVLHNGIVEEGTPFLQKPFTPAALARKVRRVLDSR